MNRDDLIAKVAAALKQDDLTTNIGYEADYVDVARVAVDALELREEERPAQTGYTKWDTRWVTPWVKS